MATSSNNHLATWRRRRALWSTVVVSQDRAQKDHMDIRILQSSMYGIPLMLVLEPEDEIRVFRGSFAPYKKTHILCKEFSTGRHRIPAQNRAPYNKYGRTTYP